MTALLWYLALGASGSLYICSRLEEGLPPDFLRGFSEDELRRTRLLTFTIITGLGPLPWLLVAYDAAVYAWRKLRFRLMEWKLHRTHKALGGIPKECPCVRCATTVCQ